MRETDGSYYFEDDLRGEPRRQAEAATQQAKCGTCQRFSVRPPEVELARAARSMGACGPAQYCFGGAVRGTCTFHGEQRDSTQLCPFYKAGGPNGLNAVGSLSRVGQGSANAGTEEAYGAPPEQAGGMGTLLGMVALVGALGAAAIWERRRTAGSSARGHDTINDTDRDQWIDNDEGLYNLWKRSRLAKRAFIRANRDLIDGAIEAMRSGRERQHYLAYPRPRGSGARRIAGK
jgi:hypothetical protein